MVRGQKHRTRQQARAVYTGDRTNPFDMCHYCKKTVVWSELMCPTKVIEKGHRHIKWMEDGVEIRTPAATVEHLIPLSEGGGNLPENIVAACWDCNNERGRVTDIARKQKPTGGKLIRMENRGKYRRHSR